MMKVSLKNIAETLKVPFDMVQWNPLLFGNAVKMLNIPIESKKVMLGVLAKHALADRTWYNMDK